MIELVRDESRGGVVPCPLLERFPGGTAILGTLCPPPSWKDFKKVKHEVAFQNALPKKILAPPLLDNSWKVASKYIRYNINLSSTRSIC